MVADTEFGQAQSQMADNLVAATALKDGCVA